MTAALETTPAPTLRFRHRPVEVEAWQFKAEFGGNLPSDAPEWLHEAFRWTATGQVGTVNPALGIYGSVALAVHTLEGVMLATNGDWIVRGIRGEIYPVKGEIFDATYDRSATYTERHGLGESLASSLLLEAAKHLSEVSSRVACHMSPADAAAMSEGWEAMHAAMAQAEAVR